MSVSSWIKNMLGVKLTDEQMKNITLSGTEVFTHVLMKGIQSGTFLGAVIIGPAYRIIKGPTTYRAVTTAAIRGGIYGAGIGAVLAPIMVYQRFKAAKVDDDGKYDRAYRLRYNRDQVRIDRGWIVGSVIGPGVAMYLAAPIEAGFVAGGLAGIALMTVYNISVHNKKN